ncbi:MAG: hypothetical protein GXC73_00490 [Chitinophagaceae bacterium]|nr:hypothetical protein [Chitinophagaceae bacterium]
MASPLTVSIVHPQYNNLKKYSPVLHFLAGTVFIAAAVYEFRIDNRITAFSELVIGIDVITLAFMRGFAEDSSRMNAIFRFIEVLVFGGLTILAALDQSWITACFLAIATGMYYYVFHCERKVINREKVSVHHLGVTISNFPKDKELEWDEITDLEALPHSITIFTSRKKILRFDFQKAIAFDELEQIHEFCRHYLKSE